ncbi:hypothetical protein HDU85_004709 [Gaertneriomyces sp. JEL0708]|nr:hypothetical protein HDU85_004709 [Gaertneriomyces sp. JEL0708]
MKYTVLKQHLTSVRLPGIHLTVVCMALAAVCHVLWMNYLLNSLPLMWVDQGYLNAWDSLLLHWFIYLTYIVATVTYPLVIADGYDTCGRLNDCKVEATVGNRENPDTVPVDVQALESFVLAIVNRVLEETLKADLPSQLPSPGTIGAPVIVGEDPLHELAVYEGVLKRAGIDISPPSTATVPNIAQPHHRRAIAEFYHYCDDDVQQTVKTMDEYVKVVNCDPDHVPNWQTFRAAFMAVFCDKVYACCLRQLGQKTTPFPVQQSRRALRTAPS